MSTHLLNKRKKQSSLKWACRDCIYENCERYPEAFATFHLNICDLCSELKAVTSARPLIKLSKEKSKDPLVIFNELVSKFVNSVSQHDFQNCLFIANKLDDIIRSILEDVIDIKELESQNETSTTLVF